MAFIIEVSNGPEARVVHHFLARNPNHQPETYKTPTTPAFATSTFTPSTKKLQVPSSIDESIGMLQLSFSKCDLLTSTRSIDQITDLHIMNIHNMYIIPASKYPQNRRRPKQKTLYRVV